MPDDHSKPLTPKRHLMNLFFVMASAIVGGIAIVYLLATYYGPTGQYKLDNVLINPSTLENLSYVDKNPFSGTTKRMVFHDIQFYHPTNTTLGWKKSPISLEKYAALYKKLSGSVSVRNVTEEHQRVFLEPGMTSLVILVKADKVQLNGADIKTFQEVQFAGDGSHYRVELHTGDPGGSTWSVFRMEGVKQMASDTLLEEGE